jgi:hypothetical protein
VNIGWDWRRRFLGEYEGALSRPMKSGASPVFSGATIVACAAVTEESLRMTRHKGDTLRRDL